MNSPTASGLVLMCVGVWLLAQVVRGDLTGRLLSWVVRP